MLVAFLEQSEQVQHVGESENANVSENVSGIAVSKVLPAVGLQSSVVALGQQEEEHRVVVNATSAVVDSESVRTTEKKMDYADK